MAIITISREVGSEGKEIGQSVAESLDYEYIDRSQILNDMKAVDKHWEELGEELDEHSPSVWERYDWSFRGFVALTQSIILNYGLRDRLVLMGRGGNFLFKDVPYALRIRISMPKEARIERVMKEEDLGRDTACWLIKKVDKEMAKAVYLIYGKDREDPAEYDMRFDLGVKTKEEVIEMIIKASVEKDTLNTEQARKALRMRAIAAKVKAGIATNPSFLIPTLDVEVAAESIVVNGIVHNLKEHKKVEEKAKELAGDIPVKCKLHYRGLLYG